MESIGQFVGEPTAWGLMDKGLDGGDQSAVTGKPNRIVGPQAGVVEAGSLTEGIVAAAMGIASFCRETVEIVLLKPGIARHDEKKPIELMLVAA